MVAMQVQGACFRGQINEAARLADDLFGRLQAVDRLQFGGENFAALGIAYASVGRKDLARAEVDRIHRNNMVTEGTTDELVALGAALGDAALAKKYLDRGIQHLRKVALPETADRSERALRALEALAAGRNQQAFDLAAGIDAKVAGDNLAQLMGFVRGVAALRLQRWDEATQAFQEQSVNLSHVGLPTLVPVIHVMLARAHAGAGRFNEARKAYEEVFTRWKAADPDLPLLVEAQREYERLKT